MLDVHPPEHKLHGVRDFFLHLFTITCGLLIALALENAAEALHHRHEREEAETSVRDEVRSNQQLLLKNKDVLVDRIKAMEALLTYAEARGTHRAATLPLNALQFNEAPIPDSAWRTANANGSIQWLPYEEVQRFSDAYKEQDLLQRTEEATLNDFFELESLEPPSASGYQDISPETAVAALPTVRRTLAHLKAMYAIGVGTVGSYNEALK